MSGRVSKPSKPMAVGALESSDCVDMPCAVVSVAKSVSSLARDASGQMHEARGPASSSRARAGYADWCRHQDVELFARQSCTHARASVLVQRLTPPAHHHGSLHSHLTRLGVPISCEITSGRPPRRDASGRPICSNFTTACPVRSVPTSSLDQTGRYMQNLFASCLSLPSMS